MLSYAHAKSLADHLKANPNPELTAPFTDTNGVIDWAKFIAFAMKFWTFILPFLTPVPPPAPTPSPAPKM